MIADHISFSMPDLKKQLSIWSAMVSVILAGGFPHGF
jgi:hypothetical protein